MKIWLTMTSLESGIHLGFGPEKTNNLKKMESEFIFSFLWESVESIYGPENNYVLFWAQEYEYVYPLREINMGPEEAESVLYVYSHFISVLYNKP